MRLEPDYLPVVASFWATLCDGRRERVDEKAAHSLTASCVLVRVRAQNAAVERPNERPNERPSGRPTEVHARPTGKERAAAVFVVRRRRLDANTPQQSLWLTSPVKEFIAPSQEGEAL